MTWDQLQSVTRTTTSKDGDDEFVTVKSCSDKSHNSPEKHWGPRDSLILPSIKIRRCLPFNDGNARYTIYINWTSPVFDLDPNVPIRKESIRDHLASQEKESYLFEHALCPHITTNDGQLLLPFEPNQCVCFENYFEERITETDSNGPQHQPHCHSCTDKSFGRCCRCLAVTSPFNERINRQGHFMCPESFYYHGSDISVFNEKKNGCNFLQPFSASHFVRCSQCYYSNYAWVRGGRNGRRVYMDLSRMFQLPDSPTTMAWLKNLDPESWGVSQDHALRHVLWCAEPGCSTRDGYSQLLKALGPHTDEAKEDLKKYHSCRMMWALIPIPEAD